MRSSGLAELSEALGACLIVLGLVFWSLPLALVVAGLFLVVVANAPGGTPSGANRGDRRVSK